MDAGRTSEPLPTSGLVGFDLVLRKVSVAPHH